MPYLRIRVAADDATQAADLASQKLNLLRDAFPAAVGFTDASWNPTELAEVDATAAAKQLSKSAAVAIQGRGIHRAAGSA